MKKTHERNVLMWLIAIAIGSCGCSAYRNSTGPSEGYASAIVMNECNKLGITAKIRYSDERRFVDGASYGSPGEKLTAAMWARIGKNEVVIWSRLAEDPETYDRAVLYAYARHECCHLKMGYGDHTVNVEVLADQCVVDNWSSQ